MNKKKLGYISIITLFILTMVGALGKIMHISFLEIFLIIALVSWLPLLLFCIVDLLRTKGLRKGEKTMWLLGFLFSGSFIIIVYLFTAASREELAKLREENRLTI